MPASIYYYITSHGFGHATRSSQIINALLSSNPSTTITISTLAPIHLFPSSTRLTFRPLPLDSPIIQPLPYEIDVSASFNALKLYFEQTLSPQQVKSSWIEQETKFLDENKFDILIADAPWSIGLLGNAPIKILLTNFTFDLIYQTLFTKHLPPSVSIQESQKYDDYINTIKRAYTNFDYLVRLPGFVDFPFLKEVECETKVLEAPLVYRTPDTRGKGEVLEELRVPAKYWEWNILLVQFGGHLLSSPRASPSLPPRWLCLLPSPSPSSEPPPLHPFYTYTSTLHMPSIVGISTTVLGKLGYGTVSECVGMGKPLIYVRREMFAEEEGLLKLLGREGMDMEMGRKDLEAGEWSECIEEICKRSEGKVLGCGDGSEAVAGIVERILKGNTDGKNKCY